MTHIITLHSFKGGSGKSLIASALAYYCANIKRKKTIIFDCDFEAPSLNSFFTHKESPQKTILDLFEGKEVLPDIITPTSLTQNLDIVYAPDPTKGKKLLLMNENWHGRALQQMIFALNKITKEFNYEYVIFDNQSGLSRNSINFLLLSTTFLLILRPSRYAASGSLSLVKDVFSKFEYFYKETRNDHVLWNQIPQGSRVTENRKLIKVYNQQFLKEGISSIGEIPYIDDLASSLFLETKYEIGEISHFFENQILEILRKLS